MAHIYHSGCYESRWKRLLRFLGKGGSMSKFEYRKSESGIDKIIHCEAYVCNGCGDHIHIDTDWLDLEGGFIGLVVDK